MDNENLCQEIEHYTSNCNNQRNEQMPKPTDSWSKDCPMSILERIFLELKPQDLCACAQVCWYWNEVSSQNSIWKPHLERDRPKWKSLTNEKSRELLSRGENQPHENNLCKYTYLISKPGATLHRSKASAIYKKLTNFSRRYKVAFFGSGLEIRGPKRIADAILTPTAASPFIAEGLHSGQSGSGSGVNVRLLNVNYMICFLYSNRKEVREQRLDMHPYSSLLFEEKKNPEDDEEELVVRKDIAKTLQEMDALVYAVNSETRRRAHLLDKKDFHALQAVCHPKTPLAVMAVIPSNDRERYSCTQICEALEMNTIDRPWLIQSVIESSLSGLPEALDWITKKV